MQFDSGVSGERFKACMSRFATGVTVVTTIDSVGAMYGVTVSSFNSVSLNPPLVLFSMERSSSRFPVFSGCSRFIVNILSDGQKSISEDFAERREGHWERCDFLISDGMPILCGIVAYFKCSVYGRYDGGDHDIIVGRVLECNLLDEEDSLLYYRGRYWMIGDRL